MIGELHWQLRSHFKEASIIFATITAVSSFTLRATMCISSHAPSRKRQIREVIGHPRTAGPQDETCFKSPFGRMECAGGS